MIKHILTTTLAALSIAALATPATAGEDQPMTITVGVADLNLSNDAGLNSLKGRLNMAIERVCGEYDRRSVQQAQNVIACREMVRREVDEQVSSLTRGRIYVVVQEPRAPRG